MRELKIRVYDKHFKQMYQDTEMFPEDFSNIVQYKVSPKQFVIMLYTGLKDKAGNEIYEGDILLDEYQCYWYDKDGNKINEIDKSCWVVMWWNEMSSYVLCNHDEKFPLELYYVESSAKECFEQSTVIDLTIAGNIYENPELTAV